MSNAVADEHARHAQIMAEQAEVDAGWAEEATATADRRAKAAANRSRTAAKAARLAADMARVAADNENPDVAGRFADRATLEAHTAWDESWAAGHLADEV